jgi:hypothetical protein
MLFRTFASADLTTGVKGYAVPVNQPAADTRCFGFGIKTANVLPAYDSELPGGFKDNERFKDAQADSGGL